MNFKLLAATTLLLTIGSATTAFSASEQDMSIVARTKKCIDCNLSRGNLSLRDLQNANVQGANLSSGNFNSSDLRNANLSHTNSKGAVFYGADLRNADFSYSDISGANLCKADLRGVNWTNVIYSTSTGCLPDAAIDYVHTVSSTTNNSNQNYNNCPSITPVSNAKPRSLKDNVNDVKEATDTVKDILKLF